MEKIIALHTVVRKYCIEQVESLKKKLRECYRINSEIVKEIGEREFIKSKDPKILKMMSETFKTSCKENIGTSVLLDIERIRVEDYKSVEELRSKLIDIVESIEIESGRASSYEEEEELKNIVNTVKNELIEYIEAVEEHTLNSVEPIYYRRVLKEEEIDNLKERINSKWEIGEFCDPFTGAEREDIVVFHEKFFQNHSNFNKLKEALRKIEEERIYEVRVWKKFGYVMDTSAFTIFKPHYDYCIEGFWCSEKMDWIIYKSHENTIALGGDKLLEEVKNSIENWEDWVFSYPEYEESDDVED